MKTDSLIAFPAHTGTLAIVMFLAATAASIAPIFAADQPAPGGPRSGVNPVARDRQVWQQLLSDHARIIRILRHSEKDGVGTVQTLTESSDPAVTAKIKDHAQAMQARMKAGAPVRIWDPVFEDLFRHHDQVTLEVTPTDRGVKVTETSRDPEAIALMRSHAIGVSAFVRHGHTIGRDPTPRLAVGGPLPPDEVAIGGLPHRFLLAQPTPEQISLLRSQGVGKVLNFRKPAEHANYDEAAATAGAGMAYCNLPYRDAAELTDDLLRAARAEYVAAEKDDIVLAPHCRTGNRVGPGLAAYLAIDRGVDVERAIFAARAVGMVDPLYESITRDYIRRTLAAAGGGEAVWTPIAAEDLSASQQAMKQRAEEARSAMFSQLLSRLSEAMVAPAADGRPGGPAGAIDVCKVEAPRIAQAVAREKGVMIGRTSDRLRNPGNSAPAWAAALLADKPAEPRIAANPDGSLGVTLPIRLMATCLACHGTPEQIDEPTRAALARAYPEDRATGYADGDLRGWFWVEVPGDAR